MSDSKVSSKKRILSGIQATGSLHLGNYIGAISNWAKLQKDYECLFSVVDLHSITVRQNPDELRELSLRNFMLYIACGIDPEENILFLQSHVSAHAELAWVLSCYTYFGEMSRMTQFKDKSAKHEENINCGLFTYPILMAADILLYQANLVPVGDDQKQHVEITRDIAERFNKIYNGTFAIPEVYIPKVGARIMDLLNPKNKMSKSESSDGGLIYLLDEPNVILKKFKRAVTDSENEIANREGKDGINNLLSIYCCVTNNTMEEAVGSFEGKGYGHFKTAVGEAVIEALRPIQEKFAYLKQNQDYVRSIYQAGAEKAEAIAAETLKKVYDAVGFVPKN